MQGRLVKQIIVSQVDDAPFKGWCRCFNAPYELAHLTHEKVINNLFMGYFVFEY